MGKLLLVQAGPDYDTVTKMVMDEDKIDEMREAGFYIEVCLEQYQLSSVAIKQLEAATGHYITLKPGEQVLNLKIDSALGQAVLLLAVVDLRETSTGFEIKKAGTRMYGFLRRQDGTYGPIGAPVTVWDEDFIPTFVRGTGRSISPREHVERTLFAKECYRPGAGLDSYERVLQGYTQELKMERHF